MTTPADHPEPPDAILPTKRCWEWYGKRPHAAHTFDRVPHVYRCPGLDETGALNRFRSTQEATTATPAPLASSDATEPAAGSTDTSEAMIARLREERDAESLAVEQVHESLSRALAERDREIERLQRTVLDLRNALRDEVIGLNCPVCGSGEFGDCVCMAEKDREIERLNGRIERIERGWRETSRECIKHWNRADKAEDAVARVRALADLWISREGWFDPSMDTQTHLIADRVYAQVGKHLRAALDVPAGPPLHEQADRDGDHIPTDGGA